MNPFQDPSGRLSPYPELEASTELAKRYTISNPQCSPRPLDLVNDRRETSSALSASSYQNTSENIGGSDAQQEGSEHVHPGRMAKIEGSSRWRARLLNDLNRGVSKGCVGERPRDDNRAVHHTGVPEHITESRPREFPKPALPTDNVELPQQSPLKNVMNFARIEEKIIQARIKYALAEKAVSSERQANGVLTRSTQRRLRETYRCLTELYGAREAIMKDRIRTTIFRKSKSEEGVSTSESGDESRGRPCSRDRASREEPNGSDTRSVLVTSPSVFALQEQRRHALTDVETFIDK
jgi:hypothetical protein